MTGVTGDLTPGDADESFVPGERREVEEAGAPIGTTTEPAVLSDPSADRRPAHPRMGADELSRGEDRF